MDYNIDKELRLLKHVRMPANKVMVWFENQLMRLFYLLQKTHQSVKHRKIKFKSRDGYVLTIDEFTPVTLRSESTIFYLHGGGFVMPASPLHKRAFSKLVNDTGARCFSLDYRLAPKWPFPTGFHDAVDGFNHLLDNAKELGINPEKIGVGGDSAGGNLAAALTLFQADSGGVLPQFQFLIYPALDVPGTEGSRTKYLDAPVLPEVVFSYVNRSYYKSVPKELEPYAYPCVHPLDKPLPPAYIEVCEFDPLHDDGEKYKTRLEKAGNSVVFREVLGAVHGYDILPFTEIVKKNYLIRLAFLESQMR